MVNNIDDKIDKKYQEGSGSYNLNGGVESGESVKGPENHSDLKKTEGNAGGWADKTNKLDSKQPLSFSNLGKIRAAYKKGGIVGLISLFLIGGVSLVGVLGPATMFASLSENLGIKNSSSTSVFERRFVKVFAGMASGDAEHMMCGGKSNLKCKKGRLSNKALRQLGRKGVTPMNGDTKINTKGRGYPAKNPTHYEFTAHDGTKRLVPAENLRSFLGDKGNRRYASKVLGYKGAFSLRTKARASRYLTKRFYKKFSVARKGGIADGKNKRYKTTQERLKSINKKLKSKIPGTEKLQGVGDRVKEKSKKKIGRSKGRSVAHTVAMASCIALKAPSFISAGVAAVELKRILPLASETLLSPGSKLKASGVDIENAVTVEDMDAVGSLITEKTEYEDTGKMSSALDSIYLQSALGINKNKPPPSEKFTPGYGVLTNPVMKKMRDAAAVTDSSCSFIMSPLGMVTYMMVESALTKTNPVGLLIGSIGGVVAFGAASLLMDKIFDHYGPKLIEALASQDFIEGARGEELGDALGISAAAFFSAEGMSNHVPTLKKDQVAAFQAMKKDNQNLQRELDIASLSPFDTSSRYTFMGSIINRFQTAALINGAYGNNFLQSFSSFATLPFQSLQSNVSAATAIGFDENYCDYAAAADLEEGRDTPAINMAFLPCTGITTEQDRMPTDEAYSLLENAGWIDTTVEIEDAADIDDLIESGAIVADGPADDSNNPLIEYLRGGTCDDASTGDYLYSIGGCVVRESANSGSVSVKGGVGANCQDFDDDGNAVNACPEGATPQGTKGGDLTAEYAAMAVFAIDFQLANIINGEDDIDTMPAATEGETGDVSGVQENSGQVNDKNWAYPLTTGSMRTYGGHNGMDMATPVGTKVYAIRDGRITDTETMPAAEVYAYCKNILGPSFRPLAQKNILIQSNIGGVTYIHRYGHLSRFNVNVGDTVKAGDLIGWSGNTGCSTGPHLHLDIHTPGVNSGCSLVKFGRCYLFPNRFMNSSW